MRYLTTVFRRMVAAERICCNEQRDIYVLMHSIADTYSGAHVERDTASDHILYLKPWQARAWVPYLLFWSGWKYFFTQTHHSFLTEERDEAYSNCPEGSTISPYAVPLACLSAAGRDACDAVEDLVVTVYGIMRDSSISDSAWQAYVGRCLRSANPNHMATAVLEPRVEDNEVDAHSTLGLQCRSSMSQGINDAFLTGTLESAQIGPLTVGIGGSAGVRLKAGRTSSYYHLDLFSWSMPLTDEVAIGMSPLIITFAGDRDLNRHNLHTAFFRLDLFPLNGIWLRLEGPRFSYFENTFNSDVSIAIGKAFSLTSTDLFSRWLRTALRQDSHRAPRGDEWIIPDSVAGGNIGPLFTGMISPVGMGFHRNGSSLFAGYELIYDRNATGIRTGAGIGGYIRAGLAHMAATDGGDIMFGMVALGPELRFKTPLLPIPLLIQPFDVAWIAGQQQDNSYELTGMASLPIDLGLVEIVLDLARWSWRDSRFDHVHFPAGIRVAVSYHESHLLRLAGF